MLTSTLALMATFGLVLANAFFVASEFAIVKMRPTRLQQLAKAGHLRARTALHISRRLDAYLSANQLGITLASLALGWIGEPAFAHLVLPLVEGMGHWAGVTAHSIAVAGSFACITFLHTVLGELAPKSLAIQHTEPVALWTAAPLRIFYLVMFPLIWTLNGASRLVLRLLGLRPTTEAEMLHTPEELRLVLQHVELDAGPRRVIDRIFDYTHRVARHVMTLRRDVVVLEVDRSFEENLRVAAVNQYTRYPVVDPASDRVVGYVHIKDLLLPVTAGQRPETLASFVRSPIVVSETAPLEELRRTFQRQRVHLAIVVDLQGFFTGIVTLEDLLEEFVGEIQDEQDVGEVPPIVRLPGGAIEVDGRLTLDVAGRELGLHLGEVPRGVETLGGYIQARLADVPRRGASLLIDGLRFIVIEVRDGAVRRMRVLPIAAAAAESEPSSR